MVFTYQHATAIGWLGLAQALSTAALKPVQVFPLQGDGGLGLHAHEGNSIFDAILVLRRAPLLAVNSDEDAGNVEFDLTISLDGEATALGRANQWERKLNGEIPGVYRVPDDINLKRAFLICAALEERFERPAGERKLLLQSLIDVAEPSFAKAC
ncbi:hypothetical protein [Streptomyces sp. NPDC048521]|uniref:hypothetical protein n=1 Tax=Streptomyces sp. NPDC048521 TaxID=3365566 RepID=UPI00371B5725